MDSFIWVGVSVLGVAESNWAVVWLVFCTSSVSSRRNATALIVLAVASSNLSDVF